MQAFTIHAPPLDSSVHFRDTTVDTSISPSGAATANVTTDKGLINPAFVLSFGHIGKPDLVSRTSTSSVRGTGSSPIDDAVSALHELGDAHGVTGIRLSSNPSLTGTIRFADANGIFVGGGDTAARVGGHEQLRAIDDAARRVLELATAG